MQVLSSDALQSKLPAFHETGTAPALAHTYPRPAVCGKFIFVDGKKFYVRGIAYGPFGPDRSETTYGEQESVAEDFRRMAELGFNTIRTYSLPPMWLLDIAQQHGLRVMVGLAWEQHIAFLEDVHRGKAIEEQVRQQVRRCHRHPAILCYTIGNEIPAHIVRWYDHRRLERFLERLYKAVKAEDPESLVTYVNYPSTEYLDLPFVDFISFNLYLETPEKLQAYLARLQNIAGNRPLVMAEIGLDSMRNGEEKQAEILRWQLQIAFACGVAGVVVFSWTDQWFRGGAEITDWAFGLTTRDRRPKLSLLSVSEAFKQTPFPDEMSWPMVSVVVCTHNGSRTIAETLQAVTKLDYPNHEVIVIDDGSTDGVSAIVQQFDVRLIRTSNRGLSAARNSGMLAAKGEIIAYIDDDAYPDPQWLRYLARAFESSEHVGIGGPNIPPIDDGTVADCVASAPGGPVHVLLTDQVAEHIPGCNMAFRRDALLSIGGFDPQFRIAGDDVDVCWRLQERGWTLGFSPAAMVWHHRRNTVRGYWKQQVNYGKAEADLERNWPEKYNAVGHLTWAGRLYGPGFISAMTWWNRRRIYHGQWGSALFQSVYHAPPSLLASLPMMPEWYVLVMLLALGSLPGLHWPPLLALAAMSAVCTIITLVQAWSQAEEVTRNTRLSRGQKFTRQLLTAFLYLIQPAARLFGRVRNGLHPWRRRGGKHWVLPRRTDVEIWNETWKAASDRVCELEQNLRAAGAVMLRGGDFDRWDIEVRGGMFAGAKVYLVVEEHGQGRQLARFSARPFWSRATLALAGSLAGIALSAGFSGSWSVMAAFLASAGLLLLGSIYECGTAIANVLAAAEMIAAKKTHELGTTAPSIPSADSAPSVDDLEMAETAS